MSADRKMLCPDCGVEMNHHAEKLGYTSMLNEPELMDPDLGGILEEAHSCPICGQTMMRRGATDSDSSARRIVDESASL